MCFFLSKFYLSTKLLYLFILAGLLLGNLSLSSFVFATESNYLPQKTFAKTSIKVVTEYYPPYQFIDNNGVLKGCAVDLVKALFKLTKDDLKINLIPWARAYYTAKNFKNTLIFSMSRNTIREKNFYWIGKIKREKYLFWGLKSKYKQKILSEAEFKDSLIVVVKYTHNDQMLTAKGGNKLHRVTKLVQGIRMLLAHRADLLVQTAFSLKKRLKIANVDANQFIPIYELSELNSDLYIAMNLKTDIKIVQQYQKAYKYLVDNGIVNKIISQCDHY